MSDSQIIGAIEIGTSKIVVLIGEILKRRRLNIIGFSELPSVGIKKGEILDFKAISEATHTAIALAEKMAEASIERVYLAQTGSHVQGFFHTATVNVSAANSVVRSEDVDRVLKEAKAKQLPEGRLYVHHIHNGFQLDGKLVKKPIGLEGQQLSVGYWSVHAEAQRVRDMIHVVNGFGLTVEDVILSSLACASVVTTEAEKSSGVLVIDLGAGVTDYVLYSGGFVVRTGILPIGGDHLTNDLSLGLRIEHQSAERLKCDIGKAIVEAEDDQQIMWLVADKTLGERSIPKQMMMRILEARCREMFELIRLDLEELWESGHRPSGIILTGGGALLNKINILAERIFEVPVRFGENPAWVREDLRLPAYSTVLGLLNYALNAQSSTIPSTPRLPDKLFYRIAKFLHLAS